MMALPLVVLSALAFATSAAVAVPRGVEHAKILRHARDIEKTYDYVVVGGGTSGLTVADRLTEDGKTTVLVIEYGEFNDSPRISSVQSGMQAMDQQFMYNIVSVPQPNLRNHTTGVMVGKVVGGSSAVNAMMTIRGTAEDYDRWGSLFQHPSGSQPEWSWNSLLPYFKKALNFVPPGDEVTRQSNITYDTSFWGNQSGVYAGWPSYQFPGTAAQFEAWREISGVEFPPDSGAGKPGVYWYPTFMDPKNVSRSYARTGHWEGKNRTNYHLITGSKVSKVLFNGTTAVGVAFVAATPAANSTQVITRVRARREVILAAGGIHTPQILQLSGVGPKKLLSAANISTLVDLPGVGQNFQDHPMFSGLFLFNNFTIHPSDFDLFTNATFQKWATALWNANKTGPFSIATGNAAAWLPFPVISPRWTEIATNLSSQNHTAYLPPDTDPTVAAGYQAQMRNLASALRSNGTAFHNAIIEPGIASGPLVMLHPLSRGTVNIDPSAPNAEPIVDYRALTNPVDGAIMVDMLRFMRRFYMNTTANARFAPQEMAPGGNATTDEDLLSYLADTLSPTEYHPAGTAAMMPRELGGVVDEQLRVYGVTGLRVVDASVMPTLPGANTCQTVYAVAEKAADLIKAAAKRSVTARHH